MTSDTRILDDGRQRRRDAENSVCPIGTYSPLCALFYLSLFNDGARCLAVCGRGKGAQAGKSNFPEPEAFHGRRTREFGEKSFLPCSFPRNKWTWYCQRCNFLLAHLGGLVACTLQSFLSRSSKTFSLHITLQKITFYSTVAFLPENMTIRDFLYCAPFCHSRLC